MWRLLGTMRGSQVMQPFMPRAIELIWSSAYYLRANVRLEVTEDVPIPRSGALYSDNIIAVGALERLTALRRPGGSGDYDVATTHQGRRVRRL